MPSKTFFHLPAEKRERLLLAAEEEFARVPYAEASINRMIRAAGIPRGSFYMYFRDKEELFHYLLKRYQDGLLQRLERVLEEQGGDLLGALPALFDDLRAQRKHWAGLARMLSRNSDMRLGLRLSPLDRPDLGSGWSGGWTGTGWSPAGGRGLDGHLPDPDIHLGHCHDTGDL